MAGKFPRDAANALLAACHRRCCVCHRFCGSKIELDHMDPGYEGGADDIENAIPVCFDCHAEIHAYNDKHPRGRKYQASELRLHKEQWLAICKNNPTVFDGAAGRAPAGPLEAMLNELEFNQFIADTKMALETGFITDQFSRATALGALAILDTPTKQAVFNGYAWILRFNEWRKKDSPHIRPPDNNLRHARGMNAMANRQKFEMQKVVFEASYGSVVSKIKEAYSKLAVFMGLPDDGGNA